MAEAIKLLDEKYIDLVITDLKMPKISGMELLQHIKRSWQNIPVIIITAHGDISEAVTAMQYGALEFITKPLDLEHLLKLTKNALEIRELSIKNQELREECWPSSASAPLSEKPAMRKIFESGCSKCADEGERPHHRRAGAQGSHRRSHPHSIAAKDKPLVNVHCSALAKAC